MHEDVHGHGSGKMSRIAIVTHKICTYTLVSTLVALIVKEVLSGRSCGEYNRTRLFEVQVGLPFLLHFLFFFKRRGALK